MMRHHMMAGMIAMGVIGILLVIVLVLGIAALIKYLFGKRDKQG